MSFSMYFTFSCTVRVKPPAPVSMKIRSTKPVLKRSVLLVPAVFVRLQLSGMLVSGVSEGLLQVAHPLLQCRMMLVSAFSESLLIRKFSVQSFQLHFGLLQFLTMSICRVTNRLFQELKPLLHGGMLILKCLGNIRMSAVSIIVAAAQLFQLLDMRYVLVRRVSQHFLQVVNSLLHTCMVLVVGPMLLSYVIVAAAQLFQLLDLRCMFVRRVSHHFFQVVNSLLHTCMVLVAGTMPVPHVVVAAAQLFQLLDMRCMFVRRVSHHFLQVVNSLLHVCMVLVAGTVPVSEIGMEVFDGLHLVLMSLSESNQIISGSMEGPTPDSFSDLKDHDHILTAWALTIAALLALTPKLDDSFSSCG